MNTANRIYSKPEHITLMVLKVVTIAAVATVVFYLPTMLQGLSNLQESVTQVYPVEWKLAGAFRVGTGN